MSHKRHQSLAVLTVSGGKANLGEPKAVSAKAESSPVKEDAASVRILSYGKGELFSSLLNLIQVPFT